MAFLSLKILFYLIGASSSFNDHFPKTFSLTYSLNVEQVCQAYSDPSAAPLSSDVEVDEEDDDGPAFRFAIVKEESSPLKEYYLFVNHTGNLQACSLVALPNRPLSLRI